MRLRSRRMGTVAVSGGWESYLVGVHCVDLIFTWSEAEVCRERKREEREGTREVVVFLSLSLCLQLSVMNWKFCCPVLPYCPRQTGIATKLPREMNRCGFWFRLVARAKDVGPYWPLWWRGTCAGGDEIACGGETVSAVARWQVDGGDWGDKLGCRSQSILTV